MAGEGLADGSDGVVRLDNDVPLLPDYFLVKRVCIHLVRRCLAELPDLLEAFNHSFHGAFVGCSEQLGEPRFQYLYRSLGLDYDLAIGAYLVGFDFHVVAEEVLVNVVGHHFVQEQDEVVEFRDRRSEEKSELFGAILAERIPEQRGAFHKRAHLIYRLQFHHERFEDRDPRSPRTLDGRRIVVGVELDVSGDLLGMPYPLVFRAEFRDVTQEDRYIPVQVVVVREAEGFEKYLIVFGHFSGFVVCMSISVENFPPFSVQYFPLLKAAERDLCAV